MTELLRVLIVEDDEQDAELVRIELERGGFQVEWSRVDTEDQMRERLGAQRWDLIVSDFAMPRFDGLKAFEVFRESKLDTPFIFVSGAIGEERAVAAMRAGARDYFLKGDLARLNAAVRREVVEAKGRAALREAEEREARERRRLAMAVDASGVGVFEHRLPPGPDTYHSERWARILGYERSELPIPEEIVPWASARVHPDDSFLTGQTFEAFASGRVERFASEFRVQHREGHWVEVAAFAKAVERDADGRASHIVGVFVDLTERRKLETQLRQAQKMESIGRLAGGIAHDFNNLLTAIFSFGTFVLDDLRSDQPAYEDMKEVLKAAKKAEALTAQLLAFSRRKPISPKIVNLNALVEDIDRLLERILGADVWVDKLLEENLWNVRVDAGSFEQVILNLAVNARDAMPDGGRLTIHTRNVEIVDERILTHDAEVPPGQYVVLEVCDEGVGIDEDSLPNVFEPFFTTKGPGYGTGLGLSTCYGIVSQAGGYVTVDSAPGRGSSFCVYIPRAAEVAAQPTPRGLTASPRGSETILVVEDDPQVRIITGRTLRSLGYRVIEAPDGECALELCRIESEPIHLVLTDVVMPRMTGHQLASQLRETRPDLRILFMSGYTPGATAKRVTGSVENHFVQKPFTPATLGRQLREVLDS